MIPSVKQLAAAQNAINAQHPSLARIPAEETVDVTLTAEHLATIASALGVATSVMLEAQSPSPAQRGWAAIIDAGLVARGAPHLERAVVEALERVEINVLERMAELVLEAGLSPRPDTPETVAEKCRGARAAFDVFRRARERGL